MTWRVACDGGTAAGASHVYPARRLAERYGMPDRIDGVSVGSLTAWAMACDRLDVLEEVWRSVDGTRAFQRLRWPWHWGSGLYTMDPLRDLCRAVIADAEVLTPCFAHYVQLDTKQIVAAPLHLLGPDERVEAVVASCSQVGIHEAVGIDGHPCGDGGLRHPLPYVRERYDTVWAVCCSPIEQPWTDNAEPGQDVGLMRPIELVLDTLQARDLALLRMQARTSEVWVVAPPARYGQPFDASAETIRHRLDETGRLAWESRRRLPRSVSEAELISILAGAT